MSTYNGEKYLKEQIDSIINQKTEVEFNLIVRDDGSTDRTCDILQDYQDKGKLSFIRGNNIGAAKGFIQLLRQTPGFEYYAFSDQDDVWYSDKVQRGINAIKGVKGPAIYCTNCELVDSSLNKIGRNTHRKKPTYSLISMLTLSSCAQGCTSMFNHELAKIVQENDVPDTFIMHDSLLTCLCGLVGGVIIYDDEPSMKYRMHDENVFGMVSARQNINMVIKDRLHEIFHKRKVSMYDQASSILETYGDAIRDENRSLCKVVIDSKGSLTARLKLVFNPELKHDTINKTITKKLEILFGND